MPTQPLQEMRYRDVTTELDIPDPEQIVGRQNHAQLVQLVRLILGAAVFGPEREGGASISRCAHVPSCFFESRAPVG